MTDIPKDGLFPAMNCLSGESFEVEWPTPADFDPDWLLDILIAKLCLPGDAALAQRLQVTPPIIKMIRDEKLAVSPSMMLRWVHATTGIGVAELLELARRKRGDA